MFIILLLVAGALVFTIWLTNWVLSKAEGPQAMRDVAAARLKRWCSPSLGGSTTHGYHCWPSTSMAGPKVEQPWHSPLPKPETLLSNTCPPQPAAPVAERLPHQSGVSWGQVTPAGVG